MENARFASYLCMENKHDECNGMHVWTKITSSGNPTPERAEHCVCNCHSEDEDYDD